MPQAPAPAYQETLKGGLVARGRRHICAGPVVGQMGLADEGRVFCEDCGGPQLTRQVSTLGCGRGMRRQKSMGHRYFWW